MPQPPRVAPESLRSVAEFSPGCAHTVRNSTETNRWSGAALIRRILQSHAQKKETRHAAEIGESPALPQILRLAGVTEFLIQHDPTDQPARSFWWEGVDGSRILTRVAATGNLDKDFSPETSSSAWPVWVGEFSPVSEIGVMSARQRKGDRKSESLLHDAEFFHAMAGKKDASSDEAAAQSEALAHAWKLLMSSPAKLLAEPISAESRESHPQGYAALATLAKSVLEPARAELTREIDTSGFAQPLVIFNSCSFARDEVISRPDGTPIYVQAPACGYVVVEADDQRPVGSFAKPVEAIERRKLIALDNGMLRLIFDRADGTIRNLRDHRVRRAVLEPGARGNVFQLQRADEPPAEMTNLHRLEIIENTPLRATVRLEWHFGDSRMVQKISLTAGSPRIDFDTEVDWHEEAQLQVAFPLQVRAPRATYDLPFGYLERPTHFNGLQHGAEVEMCAPKWADLSEGDYGVALLNDSKMGYANGASLLRLNLLSSGKTEGGLDRGPHQFTYALVPHLGDFRAGAIVPHADALNQPLTVMETEPHPGPRPAAQEFFQVDRPGVIIETIKRAEKENALIVRFYEAYGTRGSVTVTAAQPFQEVSLANLREETLQPLELLELLELLGGRVTVPIRPFEIVTLKFA